jgi:hypothetical protein
MKLELFEKLKQKFEVNAFEHNFLTLDKVLYYFSFLGNIFSVIFSYFFVKDATDSIPEFFNNQVFLISGFIIVFMSGYELLKRFAFEQLVMYMVKLKRFTIQLFMSSLLVIMLVGGSFYLSLNGAHRLIDQTEKIETSSDSLFKQERDSIFGYYQNKITVYETQAKQIYENSLNGRIRTRDKQDLKTYESNIKALEQERTTRISTLESDFKNKDQSKKSENESNTLALVLLTLFMEFIILLGVGFNAFYITKSFTDMKVLMNTPQYKQMQTNLKLLHLLYQNGSRKEGDPSMSASKFKALVSNQKLDLRQKDINDFLAYCQELDILKTSNNKKKYYAMSFDKAKELIEKSI